MIAQATCGIGNEEMANDTVIEVTEQVVYSTAVTHFPESSDPYNIFDGYEENPPAIAQEWEINTNNSPYLAHIKSLSTAWPNLRYLADFMEVGSTPRRWRFIRNNEAERQDRCQRTKVAILEFPASGVPTRKACTTAKELQNELRSNSRVSREKGLCLLVVEDLSRTVIETLGAKFDIPPSFFREHLDDNSFYNIRDRWMNAPSLAASIKYQNWSRVRFVRPRHFNTRESRDKGREEATRFNLSRKPVGDSNQWPFIDQCAMVGLTRTKVSVWYGNGPDSRPTGIVLVDPTIKEGRPLWHSYLNWASTPGMYEKTAPSGPPRTSLFEDLIYWMSKYPWPPSITDMAYSRIVQSLMQPILYLTCSEWLVMCEYVKGRLGQIEWEMSNPSHFYKDTRLIDQSLTRLHTWRRLIPRHREMVTETLQRVRPLSNSSSPEISTNRHEPFNEDIIPDVKNVLSLLNELQDRTDRLTSTIIAAISIDDSHRGLQESSSVARLTWLVSIFIPLSFVTGLFSMQEDIGKLKVTLGWYFTCAIPITIVTLSIAVLANYLGKKEGTGKKWSI